MNTEWNKLAKKWSGKIYQKRNDRVKERMAFIKRNVHLFKDKTVLDVGCNAGLFALPTLTVCKKYIGIEKEDKYFKQLKITHKQVNDSKMEIRNCRFDDLYAPKKDHPEFGGVILSRVLYYLSDADVAYLKNEILSKASAVLVVCGSKAKGWRRNKNDFWKLNAVIKLLEGYKTKVRWSGDKKLFMVVGEK